MTAAMDILSCTDSLQDMLDIDIKSEIDILVGGHNDLSGFNFTDLPPLDLDECSDIRWFSSGSNHSNSSFNLDFNGEDATTMVNPNTVMPVGSTINLAQSLRSPSPTLKESHLKFSPSSIKLNGHIKAVTAEAVSVKKDLLHKLDQLNDKKQDMKTVPKVTPIITKPIKSNPTILSFKSNVQQRLVAPVRVTQLSHFRAIATTHGRKQQLTNSRFSTDDDRRYPKPAYSYSCLIAMALKNSRSGSLPVSEIYNFMCRHFPYFKTAPNGWKNSVRHNLSLNKCFEKIEKPAINGAQRKGCLWAMNPTKIHKMDEEVQKWSRKDPTAIRKAMINPDHLEALERGELKFTYEEADTFGDSCGSAESEEGSDTEPDNDTESTLTQESIYINLTPIKAEDDTSDLDIEVADNLYDEMDIEDDQEILRMEMALAQKELLEYDKCKKRRKIYFVQD